MLFHEIYGTYFQAVRRILAAAVEHPLDEGEIRAIIREKAFGESSCNIPEALGAGRWQLLREDGTTVLRSASVMPITTLEKRWINAIAQDPRMRLFTDEPIVFPEVEPLFLPEDICVFDRYLDGDPYEDEEYIRNFRLILDAIRRQYPLRISVCNRHGGRNTLRILPEYLEYSAKDDKFRLIGKGRTRSRTINLGRIVRCERCAPEKLAGPDKKHRAGQRSVVFELADERNALERVLMHFAHLKKQAERMDDHHYRITLYYDKDDETEMLIRVLSFGPMLRVVAPAHFVNLIRQRLLEQKKL